MKRGKTFFFVFASAVIGFNSITGISAEAVLLFTENPFTAPEGYEEFDDAGLLIRAVGDSVENVYTAYRRTDETLFYDYLCCGGYKYNNVTIRISDKEVFQETYQKYSAELDFDTVTPYVELSDNTYSIGMADVYDEAGYETKDPMKIEDKSALIQEMCVEMYEAGCIVEAIYTPYIATYVRGNHNGGINVFLNTGTGDEETVRLQEILSEFSERCAVSYYEDLDCYGLSVEMGEISDLMYTIKETYPDAYGTAGIFEMAGEEVGYGAVNILAELEKPAANYGDLNQDGKISVLDAITLSKANIQAITLNESQTAAADCNADGKLDANDVTALLYYLTDKVDALPVTIE